MSDFNHTDDEHSGYERDREADERLRVARAEEVEALAKQKSKAHKRIAWAQLGAYLLIVAIILVGWRQVEDDANERCQAGRINRQALIDNVWSIENLGRDLVLGGTDPAAPTPAQQAALQRFEVFREAQLAKLADPICGGAVDLRNPATR